MEPLHLARGLAPLTTVVDGAAIALAQRAYDLPTRRKRWGTQAVVSAGHLAASLASDAVWRAATRDRAVPVEPDVTPLHESNVMIRQVVLLSAFAPVWWFGRGVPERMRRNGNARPNAVLAVPLGLAYAAASAPVWWAYAHERVAALEH